MGRSSYQTQQPSCFSRICGCCSQIVSCAFSLLILGVMGVLLWHFLGRPDVQDVTDAIANFDFDDFTNVLENITMDDFTKGLEEGDPYDGDSSTEAWETRGQGLTLELQNALDDNWQTEFQFAVDDWSVAEALTLSTKKIDVDHACSPVPGVMKVCNGNFGPTGWLGINEGTHPNRAKRETKHSFCSGDLLTISFVLPIIFLIF